MLYAITPASLLILNLILNWELFKIYGFNEKKQDKKNQVHIRYNLFLLAACCYTIVDMTWGLLYEHKEIQAFFPFIYYLTVFYFMFMLVTMLTWTRYMVAYLDKRGRNSNGLIRVVWALLIIGVICLILNRSYHLMFSYNEKNEYVGEVGRNISFLLQIAFYTLITAYMLYVAHNSTGQQRIRYRVVAATSVVLGIFLSFQIINAFFPFYAVGLMIGICLIHSFVQSGEKKEKKIHDHIASVMAEDYEAIFYIDIESGEYMTFSETPKYMSLNVMPLEKDFFKEALAALELCTYPDDLEYAKKFYNKETMLKNLENRTSFSFKYRVMLNNEPRFFLFTVMRDRNEKYLIFYEKDIEDELIAEKKQKENQKQTVTFSQIAESLASNYDVIYYIDIADSSYICYQANKTFGQLEVNKSGDDFYGESLLNIQKIIHEQDRKRLAEFIDKDNMIITMKKHKACSINYRMIVSDKTQYTKMTVYKSSDGTHFIIVIENVDDEIQKENQHRKELRTERELARRDELTGVKNKTAYKELEETLQGNIDNGFDFLSFALVVCDSNNLKQINDTLGHSAGDEYIKASSRLLCDIFVHSPIFRVGGDEFVVFLRGNDYSQRYELMEKLRGQILENKKKDSGVILATGMAEYKSETDNFVSDIFERADKEMYENKKSLKTKELLP